MFAVTSITFRSGKSHKHRVRWAELRLVPLRDTLAKCDLCSGAKVAKVGTSARARWNVCKGMRRLSFARKRTTYRSCEAVGQRNLRAVGLLPRCAKVCFGRKADASGYERPPSSVQRTDRNVSRMS